MSRSSDLTPLDLFLWGPTNPQTLEHLKANIRKFMTNILPVICRNVIESYPKRVEACRRSHGGHLKLIFTFSGKVWSLYWMKTPVSIWMLCVFLLLYFSKHTTDDPEAIVKRSKINSRAKLGKLNKQHIQHKSCGLTIWPIKLQCRPLNERYQLQSR